jgi:hypothetical protein
MILFSLYSSTHNSPSLFPLTVLILSAEYKLRSSSFYGVFSIHSVLRGFPFKQFNI